VSERHKRAVVAGMKTIMGGQRSQKLMQEVIDATYDPSLPQATNANRLRILRNNIASAAQAKQEAAKYFTQYGTLAGFKGKIPDESDLTAGIDSPAPGAAPAGINAPPVPGATQLNVSPQGNARPMPSPQKLSILKANANNPEARQAFDEIFGAGAADHFLQGGQ
jgi:hypothetical protein